MKDVSNEMLGFEAEGGPEIDAKSKKKSHPLEVVEKDAKMVEKVSQKGSKKLSKSKSNKKSIRKRYEKAWFLSPPPLAATF